MRKVRIGKLNISLGILAVALTAAVSSVAFFIGIGKAWQKNEPPVFDNPVVESCSAEEKEDVTIASEPVAEIVIAKSGKTEEKQKTGKNFNADKEKKGRDEGNISEVNDAKKEKSVKNENEADDVNVAKNENEAKNINATQNENEAEDVDAAGKVNESGKVKENPDNKSEMIFLFSFDGNNIVNEAVHEKENLQTEVKNTQEDKKSAKDVKKDDYVKKELVLTGLSQGEKKAKKSKELVCRYNPEMDIDLSDEEYEILCRIVEAEAGDQDVYGRILVANVILNRTKFWEFPDTVKEVVFQVNSNGAVQFSPISDGSFYRVEISDLTKKAVNSALAGDDYSDGALYFFMRSATSASKASWFDTLDFVLKYGCHEFFK